MKRGEATTGCVSAPSRTLMSELVANEPAPTLVRSEPAGMSGPENTDTLSSLAKRFATRRKLSMRKAFLRLAGPFPLAGPAAWSNDWHAYRPCPYPHLHEGLDMFANRGTPAVAVANGVLDEKGVSSMSGLYVELTDRKGIQYFYDHFEAFGPHLHQGMRVHQGQVLGFVGNTGDARGGPTHLHFEVQPNGIPSPPKPFVDSWLLQTIQRAKALSSGVASVPMVPAAIPFRPLIEEQMPLPAQAVAIAARPPAETGVNQNQGDTLAMSPASNRTSVGTGVPIAAFAFVGALMALGIEIRRRAARTPRP